MNDEKKSQLLIRIPESLHKWLKENVKDETIADFIVKLIENHRKSLQEVDDNDQLTWSVRDRFGSYASQEFWNVFQTRKRILKREDFAEFAREFKQEEANIDMFTEKEQKKAVDTSKFTAEVRLYFDAVRKFTTEEMNENFRLWCLVRATEKGIAEKKRDKEIKYRGNPNEVIYQALTRECIYDKFRDKTKTLSISEIAGAFKLTYHQAYNGLIPWMRNEGWNIK